MKKILLLILCCLPIALSAQIIKGMSIMAFDSIPNVTPFLPNGSEIGYSQSLKKFYYWDLDISMWKEYSPGTADTPQTTVIYCPSHGLDTASYTGKVIALRAGCNLANALATDSLQTRYVVGIPHADSLEIQISGLVYRPANGLDEGEVYYLQDSPSGESGTSAGTVSSKTFVVLDTNYIHLIDPSSTTGSTFIPYYNIPAAALSFYGTDTKAVNDTAVQNIAEVLAAAGAIIPGSILYSSNVPQISANRAYTQNADGSGLLFHAWYWNGVSVKRINTQPVAISARDTLYGGSGLLPLDSVTYVGDYPTEQEIADWYEGNWINNGLVLPNGSLVYWNEHVWEIVDDLSSTDQTDWIALIIKIKEPTAELAAENVTFTPSGSISATDVQAAILEALSDANAYADTKIGGSGAANQIPYFTGANTISSTSLLTRPDAFSIEYNYDDVGTVQTDFHMGAARIRSKLDWQIPANDVETEFLLGVDTLQWRWEYEGVSESYLNLIGGILWYAYDGNVIFSAQDSFKLYNSYAFKPGAPPGDSSIMAWDAYGTPIWTTPSEIRAGAGGGADNLGNHTMTENLQTNGEWISNDGDDEAIFITSGGRVGVNTDNPATLLHFAGGGANGGMRLDIAIGTELAAYAPLSLNNTVDGDSWMVLNSGASTGNTRVSKIIYRSARVDQAQSFSIQNGYGGTSRLYIDPAGEVGLSNTNPQERLDVTGNIQASGQIFSADGTALLPGISFTSDPTMGLAASSGALIIGTNATEAMRITTSQQVMIGTGTATETLDVNGGLRVRGDLVDVNNSPGTSGQYAKSLGDGNGFEWGDAVGDGNGIYDGGGSLTPTTTSILGGGTKNVYFENLLNFWVDVDGSLTEYFAFNTTGLEAYTSNSGGNQFSVLTAGLDGNSFGRFQYVSQDATNSSNAYFYIRNNNTDSEKGQQSSVEIDGTAANDLNLYFGQRDSNNGLIVSQGQYNAASSGHTIGLKYDFDNDEFTVGGATIITETIWRDASKTIGDFVGSGSPEGSVSASVGSTYRRTDGGLSTTLYTKESGTGTSGWHPQTNNTLENFLDPADGTVSLTRSLSFIYITDAGGTHTLSVTNIQPGAIVIVKSDADGTSTFSTSSGAYLPTGSETNSSTFAVSAASEYRLMWLGSGGGNVWIEF